MSEGDNNNKLATGFALNPQNINRNGPPKKEFSLTEGMREFLSERDPEKKKERKTMLIEKTFQMAQGGDISAIKLLWNYLDGMPKGSVGDVNIQNNIMFKWQD